MRNDFFALWEYAAHRGQHQSPAGTVAAQLNECNDRRMTMCEGKAEVPTPSR